MNRNARNLQLLCDYLDKEGYQTLTANNYAELDQLLATHPAIAGALIDLGGFDSEIWKRCEQLRSWQTPFMIISPQQSAAIQQASLTHGAKGVMIKPLVVKELVGIIQAVFGE